MKNFKITFTIEMADDVAPLTIGRIVSQIESVAYGELAKVGEFNMNTSFGTIGASIQKISIPERSLENFKNGTAPNIGPVPPVEPERKKRRRRRTKKEILEGKK